MNYLLALVLLAGVVAYAVIFIKVVPPLATLQKRAYSTYNRAYGDAYDTMINIRSVKQSVAEKYEKKRIHKGFRLRAASFWNRMNRIWQRMDLYQRLTITITEIIIFGLGVYMIRRGEMTIGELIMFNGYAAMLFDPFESLGDDWETIQEGLITLKYSEAILQTKKEAYHPKYAVTLSDITGAVVFKDVSFAYEDDEEVLKDISFSVSPGETVALVENPALEKAP